MKQFIKETEIRWSDLDPNGHLRHSVYYDWGAYARVSFLNEQGLSPDRMMELHVGPVIFREECVFKREIRLGDTAAIQLELVSARRDFSRWTVRHFIYKNEAVLAAVLTLDGAWIDTLKRKLTIPPPEAVKVFSEMPLAEGFKWTD
ncbi:acyl-CoA thioesterase [Niabella soli]|uniref:Thioesterase n=1 Tax=Niabella soli DSM 19437 TaxID=929713 RepID=W0EVQ1_9BACT|nr:acyl-CoA thioesterase [Niabella soli]AHF14885.1 thioesterase [Niabella soli DSM 19437]